MVSKRCFPTALVGTLRRIRARGFRKDEKLIASLDDVVRGEVLRRIRRPDSPFDLRALLPLDNADVVLALQIQPELRAVAEVAAEPDRGVSGDRAAAIKNVRDAAGWHTNVERQPVGAELACNKFTLEQTAGMYDRSHDIQPLWWSTISTSLNGAGLVKRLPNRANHPAWLIIFEIPETLTYLIRVRMRTKSSSDLNVICPVQLVPQK
jgi:hypothetical protein